MHFVYLVFKLELRASKDYNGNQVDLPREVSKLLQQLFEHKQETLVTQEMRKVIKLKTPTLRWQS